MVGTLGLPYGQIGAAGEAAIAHLGPPGGHVVVKHGVHEALGATVHSQFPGTHAKIHAGGFGSVARDDAALTPHRSADGFDDAAGEARRGQGHEEESGAHWLTEWEYAFGGRIVPYL